MLEMGSASLKLSLSSAGAVVCRRFAAGPAAADLISLARAGINRSAVISA